MTKKIIVIKKLADVFHNVPVEKIEACMQELGAAMVALKRSDPNAKFTEIRWHDDGVPWVTHSQERGNEVLRRRTIVPGDGALPPVN